MFNIFGRCLQVQEKSPDDSLMSVDLLPGSPDDVKPRLVRNPHTGAMDALPAAVGGTSTGEGALASRGGFRGAPEVPPACRETSVSRTANVETVGKYCDDEADCDATALAFAASDVNDSVNGFPSNREEDVHSRDKHGSEVNPFLDDSFDMDISEPNLIDAPFLNNAHKENPESEIGDNVDMNDSYMSADDAEDVSKAGDSSTLDNDTLDNANETLDNDNDTLDDAPEPTTPQTKDVFAYNLHTLAEVATDLNLSESDHE